MDERLERSISTGVTSKPASFIALAIACAFASFFVADDDLQPAPMRRPMAVPICPAPAHNMTFFHRFPPYSSALTLCAQALILLSGVSRWSPPVTLCKDFAMRSVLPHDQE